ncbi:nucleotidyltransferase domain-containing protein [Candidatus Woesearchaeota archaeon]|nr:nucleotidyltransferase domain-containing protein [Candidatus Woesearchaeota archaeon]
MTKLLSLTASKLLRVLLENPLKEFKEIELINTAKIGKGAGAEHIKTLIGEGIVLEQRVGKARIVSLNLKSLLFFFLKNMLDRQKVNLLSKSRLAAVSMFKREVQQHTSLLILFGSTIAGTATAHSDIDILVISKSHSIIHAARTKTEGAFGERLNLHVYRLQDIRSKITDDPFLRNVLLQGVILMGYDAATNLFHLLAKNERKNFQRIDYFKERIAAAKRNYVRKDYGAAQEIISHLQEQLIFYILADQKIPYQSKKDAVQAIQKLPEGELLSKVKRASLNEKIDKLEEFIREMLIRITLEEEYGF